ncbi:LPS assembly protein LptD [Thiolapillus brandeum]|uniref:LPS assembly protein LptD n=1 Tax=Thiolapillus brandeum TaxID=1076588 RepID=UPI0006971825|nr:LPS assembly protein LptD [Thiolapillus brandeum]
MKISINKLLPSLILGTILLGGAITQAAAREYRWECQPATDGSSWNCGPAGSLPPMPATPPVIKPEAHEAVPGPSTAPLPTPQKPEAEKIPASPVIQPPESAANAPVEPPAPPQTPTTPASTTAEKSVVDHQEPPVAAPEPEQEPEVSEQKEQTPSPTAKDATDIEESTPAIPVQPEEEPVTREPPEPTTPTADTADEPEPQQPTVSETRDLALLLDQGIPWQQCRLTPSRPHPASQDDGRIIVEADSATALPGEDKAHFQGSVVIQQNGNSLMSDDLQFDNRHKIVRSDERLLVQMRDLRVLGSQAWFNLQKLQGSMAEVSYRIPSRKARGEASLLEIKDRQHSHYENISYTTCPPGNNGFLLTANSMDIDQEKQIGTFRGAKLKFLGVPVFYAPKLTLPLNENRKSGLLVPSAGYSSHNGLDLTIPYYFNLAPNYDATFVPRLLSKRGLILGGEFRFLTQNNKGEFYGEVLPDDRESDEYGTRGALHARSHSNLNYLTQGLSADVDVNWVSDDNYLDDMGRSLAVTSTRHLLSRAALNWRLPQWDALAEVRDYNTLDKTIAPKDRPYSLLPRLAVNWTHFQGAAGLDYSVGVEMTSFYRDDSVTGSRFDLAPKVSMPLHRDWGFLEPALTGRYTSYELDDALPGQDNKPDRGTWSASLDSGLFFDRDTNWLGHNLTQTLEPRAYYLYTPYVNQDDLPLFDTGLLDFSFNNLFRDNRFNGPDRVGDANQLTLALTSRLLSQADGRELLNASIGQIYYFQDRRVTLYQGDPLDDSSSSIIAQLSSGMFEHWMLRAGLEYDPNADSKVRQGLAMATYRGDNGQRLHASWRLREGVLEQTDLAAVWPVSNKLSLIGRWYYSVEESHSLETVAGLEYGDCCWHLRAVWRRYLDHNGEAYNDTALLQLELNGLGKLGNNIDNFLDRTIYGY